MCTSANFLLTQWIWANMATQIEIKTEFLQRKIDNVRKLWCALTLMRLHGKQSFVANIMRMCRMPMCNKLQRVVFNVIDYKNWLTMRQTCINRSAVYRSIRHKVNCRLHYMQINTNNMQLNIEDDWIDHETAIRHKHTPSQGAISPIKVIKWMSWCFTSSATRAHILSRSTVCGV